MDGRARVMEAERPAVVRALDWQGLLLGVAFATIWSSAFTSSRIVVEYWPPFLVLSLRFLLSGAVALAIGLAAGQRVRLTRAEWQAVVLFGICQNALYLGLFHLAMQTVEAGLAAIIASSLPLFVAALGRLFLGHRLAPLAVAGLFAGFAGVLVIMAGRLGQGLDATGVAACLVGVIALAVATLTLRNAAASGKLWIVVGLQMLVGAVALFPASLAFETWEVGFSLRFLAAFLYSAIVSGVIATMIWFVLVRRVGATRAATFHFLNPFLGVAIAAAILGERVSGRDLLGVAIIMGGILAVQLSRAGRT
ncbi:MAG TPA: DMT family transporter [Amaricoccus sp.]|uniref:DMT family transporter n=3 Tax=Amaricoccus TaxID=56999 RepID=UPI002C4FE095|nr:DMT family transporter [Amaricoccus sp.]HRO10437.1 DMT family transporter [Amaricoccus sp.]